VPLTLRCADCGFEARGIDHEALAIEVRDHAWNAHGMELTTDEALRLTRPAQETSNSGVREDQP
jgi:Protein of unknown function (DUF1059)